jgi:hypothetical protein
MFRYVVDIYLYSAATGARYFLAFTWCAVDESSLKAVSIAYGIEDVTQLPDSSMSVILRQTLRPPTRW